MIQIKKIIKAIKERQRIRKDLKRLPDQEKRIQSMIKFALGKFQKISTFLSLVFVYKQILTLKS